MKDKILLKKLFFIAVFCLSLQKGSCANEKKPLLRDYSWNIYSQWGEDGIIEKIFQIIGVESKTCIEFGATDGLYFSNTANLWKNKQWKAILIESNSKHYPNLLANTKGKLCTSLIRTVGFFPNDSLESILYEIGFDESVDLLSIDIDGNDYYIFQSLQSLKPRVIICEYNPTMPAYMDIYSNPHNFSGCSVGALQRIGNELGYTLVSITNTNCFFVINREVDKFSDFDLSLKNMRIDKYLKYIITDYRGDHKIIGSKNSETPYGLNKPSQENFFGEIKTYNKLKVGKIIKKKNR